MLKFEKIIRFLKLELKKLCFQQPKISATIATKERYIDLKAAEIEELETGDFAAIFSRGEQAPKGKWELKEYMAYETRREL